MNARNVITPPVRIHHTERRYLMNIFQIRLTNSNPVRAHINVQTVVKYRYRVLSTVLPTFYYRQIDSKTRTQQISTIMFYTSTSTHTHMYHKSMNL